MIVCKLIGGLGNQMFQYAYALELAKKLDDDICFDVEFYKGKEPAIFNLEIMKRNKLKQANLLDVESAKRAERIYHVFQFIMRKINHEKIGSNIFRYLSKNGYYFNFDPFFYHFEKCYKKNKYIYGYFQGVQYFELMDAEIRRQFVSTIGDIARKYKNMIKESNAVALHIRLGDYKEKKNQYLNVCTDTYYLRGINYIQEHINNPLFYIFTNDSKLVKQKKYIPDNAIIIEGTKDYEDLMLMKECKHFVISASTFSWWGSYLSENENKITIVPKIWMSTLCDDPAIMKRSDFIRIETK